MPCFFFSGSQCIRVHRYYTGPGKADGAVDFHQAWGINQAWNFTKIDAALWSNTASYFFCGNRYIRIWHSNSDDGAGGSIDAGYPAPISQWGWGNFGKNGIDAALNSGPVDYFFSGNQYIRVTRGNTGPGKVDAGYPQPISNWGWGAFGANGIDAALYSGPVCYFFKGNQYIRVRRGDEGPGKMDPGYPAPISKWNWNGWGANGIDSALFYGFVNSDQPSSGGYQAGSGAGSGDDGGGDSLTSGDEGGDDGESV